MSIDLSGLSAAELKDLVEKKVPAEFKRREADNQRNLRGKLLEFAKQNDVSLDELLAQAGAPAKRRVSQVHYRNPNGGKNWTGQGKQPNWLIDYIAKGGNKADLAFPAA